MTGYGLGRLAAIAGLACLLLPLPPALDTPLAGRIGDVGHAFLFFLVQWAAYHACRPRTRHPLLLSVLATLLLAVGSEALQTLTLRDADVYDLLADGVGISAGLVGLRVRHSSRRWRAAYTLGLIALATYGGSLVVRAVVIAREFDRMWPVIASFEERWELGRWHVKEGTVMGQSDRFRSDGSRSLQVQCVRGRYPGVAVEEFKCDWHDYRWLEWTVFLPDGEPLDLVVRVDEIGTNRGCSVVVPVRRSGQTCRLHLRERLQEVCGLDTHRIGECHFFLDEPATRRTFFLDRLRLIKE